MPSVFSHIIQKRFSQVSENIATDALAYILESSESARNGMMKLLRGIVQELPPLRFKTQQAEGAIRPDMWGFYENEPHVFIENKFWAGLTDHQPVSYLQQLAACPHPTVLLIIAPAAREQTLWRELNHRLAAQKISTAARAAAASVPCAVNTQPRPVLALTSWGNVLSVLEHECSDDLSARADLVQLRALCDSADTDAFTPVSRAELTDQYAPAFILQLGAIVQATVELAASHKALFFGGLRPQASWDRIGRYVRVARDVPGGAGAWFGIHFGLWKTHGTTPLWLIFDDGDFGRGREVRPLIEPWAMRNGFLTAAGDYGIAVALEIPEGEEKDGVIRSLVADIQAIATVLTTLPPQQRPQATQDDSEETAP
jgi:hypothetical protein